MRGMFPVHNNVQRLMFCWICRHEELAGGDGDVQGRLTDSEFEEGEDRGK